MILGREGIEKAWSCVGHEEHAPSLGLFAHALKAQHVQTRTSLDNAMGDSLSLLVPPQIGAL